MAQQLSLICIIVCLYTEGFLPIARSITHVLVFHDVSYSLSAPPLTLEYRFVSFSSLFVTSSQHVTYPSHDMIVSVEARYIFYYYRYMVFEYLM